MNMFPNRSKSTKKAKAVKPPPPFDSFEELYMSWWIDELKDAGYIIDAKHHPGVFKLSPVQKFKTLKQLATKQREDEHTILRPHEYTPDWKIVWNEKAVGLLCKIFDENNVLNKDIKAYFWAHLSKNDNKPFSIIDVKPFFDMQNMTRLFTINQKWVFVKHRLYVQKVVTDKLFEKTFCPQRYLITNKSGKERKLKFTPVSLFEFLLGKRT